jgi:hypothetical protein
MAYENNILTVSLPLADAADFSANQYKIVKLAAGVVALAGAGEAGLGVLQNKPADGGTGGRTASVMAYGVSRVLSGAAVAVGAYVTADANGKAVTATTGQNATGIALEAAGGADAIIPILLTPGGQAA